MLLLRTIAIGTGSSSNNILNFKLVRKTLVVKLCHGKMLILRCILSPLKKKIKPPPEKKINLPPPGKSQTP